MEAVETLWESRKQLMFTYIFAYFINPHFQKEIFEVNQHDLETATEALSQYLEQELTQHNADEIKIKVMNKSRYEIIAVLSAWFIQNTFIEFNHFCFSYCKRRQTVMQEHIFDGFENNWWTFAMN